MGRWFKKGKWLEGYSDVKSLFSKIGYSVTHFGYISPNYSRGQVECPAQEKVSESGVRGLFFIAEVPYSRQENSTCQ